ncbi:BTAD domain-containing putative transcriptional regulator [Streptomyces sp. NBC_00344]|uniref:BTAD domain-containing putative transcriptional regulator n=1 Tax=Streptomyces sp. NBC_00344 TaxID=2975720 RepID=UPI002E1A5710
MQITTLGPLAVDGRPVRGERLAAVVRELVDARGRTVSTTSLIDAVWDGEPPEDVLGAVQALISRVRRLGLPVNGVPGGYRMPAEQVRIDAVEARGLVERARAALTAGDPAAARQWSDRARELFPEVPELIGGASTRLLADIAALRAELAFTGEGPFDEADLRRLAAHTPPDEPSAALLVRVLAVQGRNAEAHGIIEQLRAELAERYGTDPSPVVAAAHLALLRGEFTDLARTPGLPSGVRQPKEEPRQAAPPHPSAAALPAAWRRPGTALVGRDTDLAAVTSALAGAPLVTVVATGGAGKTRLAVEIARRAAGAGQPVRVIELAGLRSPDEVLPAVLAAVAGSDPAPGLRETGPERRALTLDERLVAAARELRGLIVLDNCEHVLDAAAAVVAALLAAAPPDFAVLATSRAPLSLVGEVVHPLPALTDTDAMDLLAARLRAGGAAQARDGDRALELCHRLDNLPLALELAAARLRHMPIGDVIAGLTDRFALLDDALRGLPERHASLWAMVDWSRELLSPGDRDLLQRLAVVPAPFTAEAAALVAGASDVRRGLARLVEQSLLSLVDDDAGPPRYRMLETVREYGGARLDASGGREAALSGLVAWARTQAVGLAADFIGPRQLVAIAGCAMEQDNLVAALRRSIAQYEEAASVDIAAALFHLWTARGLDAEITGWAQELMYADDPAARRRSAILHGDETGRPLPDADRLAWMCLLLGASSSVTGSHRLFVLARRGLRTLFAQRPGEVSARATALASVLPTLGSADLQASLGTAAALIAHPDPYVQGCGLFLRAAVRENRGLLSSSADDAEQAYRRFEAAGDHWGMGMTAQAIGDWAGSRGREGAGEWLRRGEHHLELVGAARDAGSVRVLLDIQLALAGDQDAALRLREASTSGEVKEVGTAQAHLGLAQLAWQQERYDAALTHAESAMRIADETDLPVPQALTVFRVAVAVLRLRVSVALLSPDAQRQADARAVTLLTLARDEAVSSDDMPMLGSWALGGAALAAHRGDEVRARELWAAGMRLGANVAPLFQQGHYGERLAAALGDEDGHEPLPGVAGERSGERSVAATAARVREAVSGLLG